MACPFFVPVRRLGNRDKWLHAPRLPLGDAYRGFCKAGAEPFEPPEPSQDEFCNCGYARGHCDRFPAEGADAVRFSLLSEDSARVRLVYILEKNHAPVEHGVIEYVRCGSRMEGTAQELLLAQCRAFLESHSKNKTAADSPPLESSGPSSRTFS